MRQAAEVDEKAEDGHEDRSAQIHRAHCARATWMFGASKLKNFAIWEARGT